MGFIITWLTGKVGAKLAWPVLIAGAVAALVLFGTIWHMTHRDTTAQEQAKQTTRSGDATANSAASAIGTIENRHDADQNTDAATAATQGRIENAQSPDDIHSAVVSGLCSHPGHSHDPACAVRRPNP